jgi:ferritin-like protein
VDIEIEKITVIISWILSLISTVWYVSVQYTIIRVQVNRNREELNRISSTLRREIEDHNKLIWININHMEKYLTKNQDYFPLNIQNQKYKDYGD